MKFGMKFSVKAYPVEVAPFKEVFFKQPQRGLIKKRGGHFIQMMANRTFTKFTKIIILVLKFRAILQIHKTNGRRFGTSILNFKIKTQKLRFKLKRIQFKKNSKVPMPRSMHSNAFKNPNNGKFAFKRLLNNWLVDSELGSSSKVANRLR